MDGIYFVDLSGINTSDAIIPSIAKLLNLPFAVDTTSSDQYTIQIIEYLQEKQLLLILDNFEHILEGAKEVVDIIQNASDVQIIVTSREALNVQSEWIRNVRGLPYVTSQTDNLELSPAIHLFADRARQYTRDFSVDNDYEYILRICKLVDGMPLAIELVAGWLKSLSCEATVYEIERSIDILTTRSRDMPQKHRSIRAIFDGTWQQLSKTEQDVLAKLSICRGGFTYEAALHIADATIPLITTLVDRSLICSESSDRFSIQELLRQYANEQLRASNTTDVVYVSHYRYYFRQLHKLNIATCSDGTGQVALDMDNIYLAWDSAVQYKDYENIREVAWSFHNLLQLHGRDDDLSSMYQRAMNRIEQKQPQGVNGIVYGYILALWGHLNTGSIERRQNALSQGIIILQDLNAKREEAIATLYSLDHLNKDNVIKFNEQTAEVLTIIRDINQPMLTMIMLLRISRLIAWHKIVDRYSDAEVYLSEVLMISDILDDVHYNAEALFRFC